MLPFTSGLSNGTYRFPFDSPHERASGFRGVFVFRRESWRRSGRLRGPLNPPRSSENERPLGASSKRRPWRRGRSLRGSSADRRSPRRTSPRRTSPRAPSLRGAPRDSKRLLRGFLSPCSRRGLRGPLGSRGGLARPPRPRCPPPFRVSDSPFSMSRTTAFQSDRSSGETSANASPVRPARAVRPIR